MKGRFHHRAPLVLALCLGVLSGYHWHTRPPPGMAQPFEIYDRVVVPPALQAILVGGDRFLAADIEAIRALATLNDAPDASSDNLSFAVRSRDAVARLNPCHEDNYYLANALLTWGGAANYGNDVLKRATECRFWDEFPPFFLGFNLFYFNHDAAAGKTALELAADRSKSNGAVLRKLAIMLTAETLEDAAALAYLDKERAQAKDERLRGMLEKRIARLQGLMKLRQGQALYAERFGKALEDPQQLIEAGILSDFPEDPMKIGYEFEEGIFRMREVKIPGMEQGNR